jgi:hypothetical protein
MLIIFNFNLWYKIIYFIICIFISWSRFLLFLGYLLIVHYSPSFGVLSQSKMVSLIFFLKAEILFAFCNKLLTTPLNVEQNGSFELVKRQSKIQRLHYTVFVLVSWFWVKQPN